ncbi:hypothetical protein IWQ60_007728 [Tieghemiomyces parasiticus]|uniref:Uncharacterized protein n=1 Tax=Tieghemiomyces parasiticus TaxID=78921 RepID=A0A9W8DPQ9_9FUNG|nr:hypothetical protein IWQ60_007728 [Tieghemiomyces parasiticus]
MPTILESWVPINDLPALPALTDEEFRTTYGPLVRNIFYHLMITVPGTYGCEVSRDTTDPEFSVDRICNDEEVNDRFLDAAPAALTRIQPHLPLALRAQSARIEVILDPAYDTHASDDSIIRLIRAKNVAQLADLGRYTYQQGFEQQLNGFLTSNEIPLAHQNALNDLLTIELISTNNPRPSEVEELFSSDEYFDLEVMHDRLRDEIHKFFLEDVTFTLVNRREWPEVADYATYFLSRPPLNDPNYPTQDETMKFITLVPRGRLVNHGINNQDAFMSEGGRLVAHDTMSMDSSDDDGNYYSTPEDSQSEVSGGDDMSIESVDHVEPVLLYQERYSQSGVKEANMPYPQRFSKSDGYELFYAWKVRDGSDLNSSDDDAHDLGPGIIAMAFDDSTVFDTYPRMA